MERHVIDADDGEIILVVDESGVWDVAEGNVQSHVWIAERGSDEYPWIVYTRDEACIVVLPPPDQWWYPCLGELIERYYDLRHARRTGLPIEEALRAVVSKYRPDLASAWQQADVEIALLDAPLE
jgi:hypothetical protein